MLPTLFPTEIEVQRDIWSKHYYATPANNWTELECAAYTLLHWTDTIDFFAYFGNVCYFGAFNFSSTIPFYNDPTKIDTVKMHNGKKMI